MKKLFMLIISILTITSIFTGCANVSESKPTPPFVAKYAVGDIIQKDGSKIAYHIGLNLTPEQKASAVAIIYVADTESTPALGVGIGGYNNVKWCTADAKAYNRIITPIIGYRGTDDTDGSDNLSQIAAFLGSENDTSDESKYPAFYTAIKHGNNFKGSPFENGWYLPTIDECSILIEEESRIYAALDLCGGATSLFKLQTIWTSSAEALYSDKVIAIDYNKNPLTSNYAYADLKKDDDSSVVIPIRKFN